MHVKPASQLAVTKKHGEILYIP